VVEWPRHAKDRLRHYRRPQSLVQIFRKRRASLLGFLAQAFRDGVSFWMLANAWKHKRL
jgi:hypothetical protein